MNDSFLPKEFVTGQILKLLVSVYNIYDGMLIFAYENPEPFRAAEWFLANSKTETDGIFYSQ